MSKAYTPEFMGDPNPREKILKLARKITDCVDHKILGVTVNDPEYWGLACVVTDEMADVALKMKVRHHYTFEDLLAKNPELGKEKLQKLLDDMSRVGILEYDYGDNYDHNGPIKGAKKIRRYTLPMFVPGSAEFTNMIKKQLDDHPELAMFFERMTYLPLTMVTPMVPPGGAGIGMHVIPVEKAIEMENGTMDIEHISYWLKKYEGHLGVGICSCRYGRAKLGEGCGDSCEEWCIGIGDMADYCRETGKGRDITYDEAMQILKNAEKTYNTKMRAIINFSQELASKLYGAADMFLMPSKFEPCGLGQMIAMRYGAVPIVRETGGLKDTVEAFNPVTQKGNGFTFKAYQAYDMLDAVWRTLGTYFDKNLWKKVQSNAMKCDFSWKRSAKEYLDIYKEITK